LGGEPLVYMSDFSSGGFSVFGFLSPEMLKKSGERDILGLFFAPTQNFKRPN
jgi:hypothetical protein